LKQEGTSLFIAKIILQRQSSSVISPLVKGEASVEPLNLSPQGPTLLFSLFFINAISCSKPLTWLGSSSRMLV